MSTITPAAAARVLGVAPDATEAEIRHRYREVARACHPDKTQQSSSDEFVQLQEALNVLLAATPHRDPSKGPESMARPDGMRESERLDKHFCGTHFGSDKFDPRAWFGEASEEALIRGDPIQCVWRCKACPEQSSVCCRLKPKKFSCLCGHKVEAHLQQRHFRCGTKGCRCPRLQFHVQQLGWEARCGCKHHLRDHAQAEGPPYRCTKTLPGKDKKPCPCRSFHVSWVCTCGHGWDLHETTWQEGVSKAMFAREWVAQGLRPECVAEAEEKRNKCSAEAASLAAERGEHEALQFVTEKAKRMQVSMCAEARMKEAVEDTLDGSRLPAPAPKQLPAQPSLPAECPPLRPAIISDRANMSNTRKNMATATARAKHVASPSVETVRPSRSRVHATASVTTSGKQEIRASGYLGSSEATRRLRPDGAAASRQHVLAGSSEGVSSGGYKSKSQGNIFVNVTVDPLSLTPESETF